MIMDNRRPHGTPKDGKAQLKRVAVALFVERMYMADRYKLVLAVGDTVSVFEIQESKRTTAAGNRWQG
jgi:hypothetical protein